MSDGSDWDDRGDRNDRSDGGSREDERDRGEGAERASERPEIALVAAVAANGVIGADGDMPWHYPADLRRFKRLTTGHPVVMGRRTYESIAARLGGPLPDRTNVVLTTRELDLPEGTVRAGSIEEALDAAREAAAGADDVVFVVGGATVYEQFLPRADRMYLTELRATYEGDTRFPEWDRDAWCEVDRDDRGEFAFVEYERRS
ncbi:dihydrofolate reductase [Halomarina halobia]|uniref:dihydrofolate reductase n=1 Tax=Halomarina halobia TaxID=3033386 RepID=A0ABD6A646_9EURY|nr:dihydrofolate reductase [Halomarina sp. PSR21]